MKDKIITSSFDQNALTNKLEYNINVNFKLKELKTLTENLLINRNIFKNQFQKKNF